MGSRAEYKRAWCAANKDKVAAYTAKWNAENREKRRAIERSWRERNPAKVQEMNRKAGAKWAKANPGKRNAITRRRQMALRQRLPKWADLAAIESFYVRAAEMSRTTGIPHEVDHILPLQGETISGLHVPENLQILPRSLNRAKQNKVAD